MKIDNVELRVMIATARKAYADDPTVTRRKLLERLERIYAFRMSLCGTQRSVDRLRAAGLSTRQFPD